MPWGCWVELEVKDVHCKEWECIIENFTEEEADTTVRQIYGQRATLSVHYKPGDWESVRAWILKAGSGWHQAETAEDPQNMNKFAAGSPGAVTAHRIKWILSGRSAVEQMRQWQQALQAEQIIDAGPKRVSPLSAFKITQTKEGGMMVITTTRITQMHDIVKTLQDGPESVKEILWSEGPWLGAELDKAWENYYEVQGYLPFATCGNDQCRSKDLCVLTSAALPSTSPSSLLHAPFNPFTPGSQVPGVDSSCSPLHQVRGGISRSRGNASKTWASLPQATVEQKRRELVAFCQQCWQFTNFRHNKGKIGILPLMVRLLIDTYRTAEHQPGRLRGELTSQEIKKYVAMCLKPGKSTGPNRCPNELTKTMTDEEF